MSPRPIVLALASLLAAATAHAQAPGQWQPSADPYAPPPAPAAATFTQRWSVGLSLGALRIEPSDNPGAGASFDLGQLALRFRPWRHLELELSGGGGRQQAEDGSEGELAVATVTFAARYRFRIEQRWNWWLMAGLGGTTVARHDASELEVEEAQRPHGMVGIGVEHRWHRFALQAEARAVALGQTAAEMDYYDQTGQMIGGELSGGSFTIGASYYF